MTTNQPTPERLADLRTMPYEEYLQTPEWRGKREQVLGRDNYCCRVCNSDERLHVHHRTYERRGNEDLEDLTTLCEECHERFHRKTSQAEPKIEQRYQRREFLERVRSVVKDNDIYVNQLTPAASIPTVSNTNVTIAPHLSAFGFGASLQAIASQYGQPTKYTKPPLYAFQDGNGTWPQGSLIIATMKEDRAVEFSYVPGTDHPMTYQEAQDFAVKLLPDDAQGPKTVQQEDNHNGKCLAKIYHSDILKRIFPSDDFISSDGKDGDLGSVTMNFYPDQATNFDGGYENTGDFGSNRIINASIVNSILINLGSRPSC